MFQEAFPILSSRDLGRALGFYRDLLGATVVYEYAEDGVLGYVALRLGSSSLGLGYAPDTPDGAQRWALWVYTDDCDAAVAKLRDAGVRVLEEPVDQPWGERVAKVSDPDGNEVHIGQRSTDQDVAAS